MLCNTRTRAVSDTLRIRYAGCPGRHNGDRKNPLSSILGWRTDILGGALGSWSVQVQYTFSNIEQTEILDNCIKISNTAGTNFPGEMRGDAWAYKEHF